MAVLIKPYEPERQGGQIVIPDNVAGRMSMVDQRAVVVAVGEAAWKDEGYWKPALWGLFRRWIQHPRAKVGDRVLVTKFAGFMAGEGITQDKQQYRLVNDRDIFCVINWEGAVRVSGEEKDTRREDEITDEHQKSFIRRDRIGEL